MSSSESASLRRSAAVCAMARLELAFQISRAVACASVTTLDDDGENEARREELSCSRLSRLGGGGSLQGEAGWDTRPKRPNRLVRGAEGGEAKALAGGCRGSGLEWLLASASGVHDTLVERCASSGSPRRIEAMARSTATRQTSSALSSAASSSAISA